MQYTTFYIIEYNANNIKIKPLIFSSHLHFNAAILHFLRKAHFAPSLFPFNRRFGRCKKSIPENPTIVTNTNNKAAKISVPR